MKRKDWKREDVQLYIIDCYAGTELQKMWNGVEKPVRQFLWQDAAGEVWLGNSAAFASHVAERFGFTPNKFDYISVNNILLDLGERIVPVEKRNAKAGRVKGSYVQEPQKERAK